MPFAISLYDHNYVYPMKPNITRGKLSLANLLAAMLFSKLLVIAGFYWMHDLDLNANFQALILRVTELLIFLSLVSSLDWPQEVSMRLSLFRRPPDKNIRMEILIKVLIVIAVAIISRYAIEILAVVLSDIFGSEELEKMRTITPIAKEGWAQFYQDLKSGKVIAQASIIPVVEEIIHRGVLLNYLMLRYRPIKAVVLSSLIFAVFHSNPIAALLGGLGFGLLYVSTGNLIYSILAHGIANLTIVGLYSFSLHTFSFAFEPSGWLAKMWICGAALGWLLLLGYLMFRYANIKGSRPFGYSPLNKGL